MAGYLYRCCDLVPTAMAGLAARRRKHGGSVPMLSSPALDRRNDRTPAQAPWLLAWAEETISKRRAESSDNNEPRFTPFEFVATALLILSVFSGPALVWSLLRSASLG